MDFDSKDFFLSSNSSKERKYSDDFNFCQSFSFKNFEKLFDREFGEFIWR